MSATGLPGASEVLEAAARLHGVAASDLTALGSFESDVYAFTGPSGPAILKVMAPGHRTVDQVQAEVDWLLALAESGVPVAPPLRARTGAWVEEVAPGAELVVAYRKAEGRITGPSDWTAASIERWGEVLGRLQAHSRAWRPPGPRRKRYAETSHFGLVAALAETEPEFHAGALALRERVQPFIDGSGDGGLVHADLHHGNVLLHEDAWTAIDFDDCGYSSYAFDLAMPIYYAVRSQRDLTPAQAAKRFVPPFLRGFRRWAPDPEASAEDYDAILRFRQVEEFVALTLKFPAEKVTPRLQAVARDLRDRVVAGVEVVPLDVLDGCLD